ncbi:hypothetical protein C5167_026370 [Papaver somniferum]|nr:hypothetical protein C5167_026370 [Papaver somniferum]
MGWGLWGLEAGENTPVLELGGTSDELGIGGGELSVQMVVVALLELGVWVKLEVVLVVELELEAMLLVDLVVAKEWEVMLSSLKALCGGGGIGGGGGGGREVEEVLVVGLDYGSSSTELGGGGGFVGEGGEDFWQVEVCWWR